MELRTENHQRFNFEDPHSCHSSARHDPPCPPVILVIDEASMLTMLTGKDNEIIDDFISTLWCLKDSCISSCLHSIVLVGTEPVRGVLVSHSLEGQSVYSPFTEETFECIRFTVSEVKELLGQLVEAEDLDLEVNGISKMVSVEILLSGSS